MDLLADVSESGARAGIGSCHAAVADRGEKHCDHGDENCCDHVAVRRFTHHAKGWHGCSRLDDDDPVEDEVPKAQGTPQLDCVTRAYSACSPQLISNLVSWQAPKKGMKAANEFRRRIY